MSGMRERSAKEVPGGRGGTGCGRDGLAGLEEQWELGVELERWLDGEQGSPLIESSCFMVRLEKKVY